MLLVSFFFAPWNTIGAVRVSKLAKYLPDFGWEPMVLTAIPPLYAETTLPLEIDPSNIYRTKWFDPLGINVLSRLRRRLDRTKGPAQGNVPQTSTGGFPGSSVFEYTRKLFKPSAVRLPDRFIGWLPYALKEGIRIVSGHKIDVIYSSAGPVVSTLVASMLHRKTNIPWVAEFRDLWALNHSEHRSQPFQWMEEALERFTLKEALHLVTVSCALAQELARLHRNSNVIIIPNGFDEEDYKLVVSPTSKFTISYTGNIYKGKQDPSALFLAITNMARNGLISKDNFEVRFYGKYMGSVPELVAKYKLDGLVRLYGQVPFHESIRRQKESSALLLLEWTDPSARGVLTGKVFEYLGAGRPILAVGPRYGSIEQLLKETGAGILLTEPHEIEVLLTNWIIQGPPSLTVASDPSPLRKYTRRFQASQVASLLESAIKYSSKH